MKVEKEKIIEIAPGFFHQFDLSDNIKLNNKSRFLECLNKFIPEKNLTKNLLVIFQEQFIIKNRIFIDLKLINQKLQSFPLTGEKIKEIPQETHNIRQVSEVTTNKISKPEIKKNCCCGKIIFYKPRNLKNIPKRPKTQCSHCKKWIYFKRHDVITFATEMINFDLTNSDQLMTNFDQFTTESERPERKSANTKDSIDRNQVESIFSHDQFQKNDQFSTKTDQFTTEAEKPERKSANSKSRKKIPFEIESISIHKNRFGQDLITKGNWLYGLPYNRIKKRGKIAYWSSYKGYDVRKAPMNNWDRYIIYIRDYDKYSGLANIEIDNNVVIYNFIKKRDIIKTGEELLANLDNLVVNCLKVKEEVLENDLGFKIGSRTPYRVQKPDIVIESDTNNIQADLGKLGKYFEIIFNIPGQPLIKADDSDKEDGHIELEAMETDIIASLDRDKNIDQIRKDVDQIKKDMSGLNNTINQMTQSQSQVFQFQSQLVQAQTTMANAITNLTNLMKNQMTNQNPNGQNPGGMFN